MEKKLLNNPAPASKKSGTAGWIISGLLIAFFLIDSIGKIVMETHSVSGSEALGWPVTAVRGIGLVLLFSTILYAYPKTDVIGAILITGYLGGALAIMIRAGQPLYFALIFEFLVWTGLSLRNEKVKQLLIG